MNWTLLELENLRPLGGLMHHVRSHNVTRHQVRGELDSREIQVQDVCHSSNDFRLADPGDAFEQNMALGEQADQRTINNLLGTDDNLANFLADTCELVSKQAYSVFDFDCHWFSRGLIARKYLFTRFR